MRAITSSSSSRRSTVVYGRVIKYATFFTDSFIVETYVDHCIDKLINVVGLSPACFQDCGRIRRISLSRPEDCLMAIGARSGVVAVQSELVNDPFNLRKPDVASPSRQLANSFLDPLQVCHSCPEFSS